MCLEEKGVSSSVLSMKSITDGFRIVSYKKEWEFFLILFLVFSRVAFNNTLNGIKHIIL